MGTHLAIPKETIQLFERKIDSHTPPHSLEDAVKLVYDSTASFQYGTSRAISSFILFPWPHEVEELQEAGCGSRALYRLLFANFLKERFSLPYNAVFILGQNHAAIGLYNGDKHYTIDSRVEQSNESDTSKLQLELDEVLELVGNVRSQNFLDVLMEGRDSTILRRSQNGKTSDMTARYDKSSKDSVS